MSPFKVLSSNSLLKLFRKSADKDYTKRFGSAYHAICTELRFNFHDAIKINFTWFISFIEVSVSSKNPPALAFTSSIQNFEFRIHC